LTVRSSVSAGVTPYFTSRPTSPSRSNDAAPVSRTPRASAYGFTRRLRPAPGGSSPTRFPASDTRDRENSRGMGDQKSTSFFRRRRRLKLMPQTPLPPRSKRSERNGIAISAIQPSSTRLVLTNHTASQLAFTSRPSFALCWSARAPSTFVMNTKPLRRSANVSRMTSKVSDSSWSKSLRMSLMTMPPGADSRQYAAT
jgi:hypothetical protein